MPAATPVHTATIPAQVPSGRSTSGHPPRDIQHYMRAGTLHLTALPPLSLYIHIPWCLRKCPYCDFNSHAVRPAAKTGVGRAAGTLAPSPPDATTLPVQLYIDALVADLDSCLPLIWGRGVHSIFIGGGTPSLFAPEAIDQLLSHIRARVRLEADCEITLEANPGTFERGRFAAYRDAGVTRLSIGVQSFDDRFLHAVGRMHNAQQALQAVQEAAHAFTHFNLDLMYALPGQTLPDLQRDLRTALALQPPHLSVYHLTIEPNTLFAFHPPVVPDEDMASDMLDAITTLTQNSGLQRYEVSAYARGTARRCWHNLNYWAFGDYLGIGAGAHGKLSFAHRIVRQVRLRDPARYMEAALRGQAIASEHEVSRRDLPFEYMLGALRLREGFSLADFTARTGLPTSSVTVALERAQTLDLITRDSTGHIAPTKRGFDFLSDLQALFLPD